MIRNTATATRLTSGTGGNAIPTEATVQLNGRVLPGWSARDFLAELRAVLGPDVELVAEQDADGESHTLDLDFLPTLSQAVSRHDAAGYCVPFLMPAGTDGRFLRRLGIQPYGFLPMKLPPDWNVFELMHARDERVPVEALEFGARVLADVIRSPTSAAGKW